jgi:hypothetical protein
VSVIINRSVERQRQEYQERYNCVVLNFDLRNAKTCKDVARENICTSVYSVRRKKNCKEMTIQLVTKFYK